MKRKKNCVKVKFCSCYIVENVMFDEKVAMKRQADEKRQAERVAAVSFLCERLMVTMLIAQFLSYFPCVLPNQYRAILLLMTLTAYYCSDVVVRSYTGSMKWLKVLVPPVCNSAGICLGSAVLALLWCLIDKAS